MINQADVITMLIPFPAIDSTLAVKSHMYICLQDGRNKEFVKCQTFKPTHLIANKPPREYLLEDPDDTRNPFVRKTTIDCDKYFSISNVTIRRDLLARRNACHALFEAVIGKLRHPRCSQVVLDPHQVATINSMISHP